MDITSTLRIRKTLKEVQNVIEDKNVKEADVIEDNTKK